MYKTTKKVHVHSYILSMDKYMYMYYNKTIPKEVNTVAGKKKSGNKDRTLQTLVFATAILNLIQAIFGLIEKFLE